MNNHATPDNFKVGERWIATDSSFQTLRGPWFEIQCLEWSESGEYVKIRALPNGLPRWTRNKPFLLERLPDESSVNQAAKSARTVEDDSAKPCEREDCRRIRQELTQRIIHEAAKEIPEGKTFTVATQAEIAAQSDDHGTD